MTGETYQYEYIRSTEREKALRNLARAKELEQQREEKVKNGKLRKRITYDPAQKLTTIQYV